MNENHNIKCNVCNCDYNEKEHCCAKEICVGPGYANTSSDTVCNTFKCSDCK